MLINVNIVPTQLFVIVIYVKHMVVIMLVPRVNLLVLELFVNLHILWAVINLLFFLQFTSLITLVIFVLVKLFVAVLAVNLYINTLIKSEPVNYCLVTYTEHPMNVISFIVRKSVVSYRTACPVDFDAFVETINVALLSTSCCVSFKIPHHITCHFHFGTSTAFSKATCNTLSLLITIISLITTFPINAPSSSPLSLLLPPSPSASSQSVWSLSPSSLFASC